MASKQPEPSTYLVLRESGTRAPIVMSIHTCPNEAERSARAEADLDQNNDSFAVYQKIGTARASRSVTWREAGR